MAQVVGKATLGVAVCLATSSSSAGLSSGCSLALLTRPAWKQFDLMEVLNDWENKKKGPSVAGGSPGDDETLQSMVEKG